MAILGRPEIQEQLQPVMLRETELVAPALGIKLQSFET